MIADYDDLPVLEKIGIRTSWGILPLSEGTLSFIEPDSVAAASRAVISGTVLSLSLGSAELQPPLFDRPPTRHRLHETTRNVFEDDISDFNPQSGSQWDGLLHIRAREFGYYGGITDLEEAKEQLGMHHWGLRGIAARGILVDVPAHLGEAWDPFAGATVNTDVIRAALDEQGTTLQPGDILCLRLGWIAEYRRRVALGEPMSRVGERFSGIASDDDMVRFLWNSRIAAIAADNPAVESAPGDPANGSLHRKLIPGLGFALAELLDFDALAAACKQRGRYDFLFVAAPMTGTGFASSSANAIAIL